MKFFQNTSQECKETRLILNKHTLNVNFLNFSANKSMLKIHIYKQRPNTQAFSILLL